MRNMMYFCVNRFVGIQQFITMQSDQHHHCSLLAFRFLQRYLLDGDAHAHRVRGRCPST